MNDNSDDKTEDELKSLCIRDKNGNTYACHQHSPCAQSSLTRNVSWNSANTDGVAADCEGSPAVDRGEKVSLNHQYVQALDHQKPSSDLTSKRMLDRYEDASCQSFAHVLNTEEPEYLPNSCHSPGAAQDQKAERMLPFGWKPNTDLNGRDHLPDLDPNRTFDMRVDPVNCTFVTRHAIDRSQSLHTSGSVQSPGMSPGNASSLSSSTQWPSHSDKVRVREESYDGESFENPLVTPAEAQNTTYTVFSDMTMQTTFVPDPGNQCQYSSGRVTTEDTDGPQQRPVGDKETQALTPVSGSLDVPNGCVLQEFFCLSEDEPESEMHSRSPYGQKEMGQNLRETVSNCLIDDECPLLVPPFDKSQKQVLNPELKATVTGDVHFAPDEKDVGTQNCTLALILHSPPGRKTASSFQLSWDANDVVINTDNTVCMSTPVLEPADVTFSISPIEAAEKSRKVVKSNRELRNLPDPKGAPINMPKPSLGRSVTKTNTPTGSKLRKTEIISYPRPNFKHVKAKVVSRPALQPREAASSRVVPRAQPASATSASAVSSSGQWAASSKAPRPDLNADAKTELLITKTHKQHFNELLTSQAGCATTPPENTPHRLPGAAPAEKANQDEVDKASSSNSDETGAAPACFQRSKGIIPVKMESAECLEVTYISSIDRISPEKKGEKGNGTPVEKQELKGEMMNKTFELGALFLGSAPKTATSSGRNLSKPDSCSLRKTSGPKAKVGPAASCLRCSSDSRNLNSDRAFSPQRIRRVSTSAGNAAVIKHEERAPKPACQNASLGSSCLKPLVARAHAHLLKSPLKGPSRKNVFSVFNAGNKK